ncbi:hypothetical protein [Saccharicrinis aurantiacus]|uniref:hypothetical protein n=1 Tax=Saccharicrinis aurantiacus TaxID=1849719 RepID=UPI002491286E|nr:hypothetical protein [Saccharicrinis aurantiacus]
MEQDKIHQALERICGSEFFEKSPQNIRIIKYLVEQALNNEYVKEYSLGMAIFGESYKPEESTSKVRVAMFKFRKKLEQYYTEEGKNDHLIFVVKKGQYNLEIKHKNKQKTHQLKTKQYYIPAAIIVLIGISSILFFAKQQTHSFWDYYFAPDSNNICFISDEFVISEKMADGKFQFITTTSVTDRDDFRAYQISNGKENIKPANFSYTSKMAPIVINELAPWFWENNSKMSVRLESEFKFNDISSHNLIFIGHFRNHKNAKELFLSNSEVFKTQKNGFIYNNSKDSINYKNSLVDMTRVDYTMVSFMNLDNGKKALFIASNHDIGVIALSKKLSDKKQLKEFYSKIPNKETNFNALFKVSGMKRTDIGCELVQLELIPKGE